MSTPQVHEVHQQVILARLRAFCDAAISGKSEDYAFWTDMTSKLHEASDHVYQFKQEQLTTARNRFVELLKAGKLADKDIIEFKAVLDSYLSIGDYADIVFNLVPSSLALPAKRDFTIKSMDNLKAHSLLEEARKPEEQQSSRSKKLITEIYQRLGFEVCEKILVHKKLSPERRRRLVLHRIGLRVTEYCTVLHFPSSPEDIFSPFLLTRVEALLACCLRLLAKFPS